MNPTPARISRRSALGLGAAGLAALALGAWGLSPGMTVPRAPRVPLRALSPQQFSVLAAVADVVSPGGPGVPSAWEVQVPEKLDALLALAEPALVQELGLGLLLLENRAGRLLSGRGGRSFTQSSPEERAATLLAWRTQGAGVQRAVAKALVALCSATCWASPELWPLCGYPGPGIHLGGT